MYIYLVTMFLFTFIIHGNNGPLCEILENMLSVSTSTYHWCDQVNFQIRSSNLHVSSSL